MIEPQTPTQAVSVSALNLTKIKREEWRWVWIWSIVTLALTLLPFIWAWWLAPPGTQFMGFLFNATDGNSYLAKMQQGSEGHWLFHLTYSPENSSGALLFVPYLLLGHLAALLGLSNVIIFHTARLVFGLALLLVSYKFISTIFSDVKQRQLAFLLICFGAGVGWLVLPVAGLAASTDTWVAESLTFFSILANPHFPLATTLLLLSIMWVREAFEKVGRPAPIAFGKAAVAAFVLGWVHPFLLISLGAVMAAYLLRLNLAATQLTLTKWFGLILVGVVGAPGPIYTFAATTSDPVYRAWMNQNQTLSPWPWFYLTGYGLLAVLAIFGAWRVEVGKWSGDETSQRRRQRLQLLTTWVVITAILLYLPVSFQRRFVEGLQLPIVCLATYGFYEVFWPWRKQQRPKASLQRWAGRLILFSSVTTMIIILLFLSFSFARQDASTGAPAHPLYYYNGEVAAFNWLRSHTQPNETVLAGPIDGNYIPARAGNRVFYGHELETIDRIHKAVLLTQFFKASTAQVQRNQLIQEYNLHYLYYGAEEKHLLGDEAAFDPAQDGWPVVFQNEMVTIYRLKN